MGETLPREVRAMTPLRIEIESAGNARITNRAGETVAVLEDWRLWVNGRYVGEVDSYHEATQKTLDSIGG
jgi:hypothetical protein